MLSTLIGILVLLTISVGIGIIVYFIMEAKNRKTKNNFYGGCSSTRWGCCKDGITPKYDQSGSNCKRIEHKIPSDMKFPQYNDNCGDNCDNSILNNNYKPNSNVVETEN